MKLWLLTQTVVTGWGTYDSAVVVAESFDEAVKIHPRGGHIAANRTAFMNHYDSWPFNETDVSAQCIGEATSDWTAGEVVCASFNAG